MKKENPTPDAPIPAAQTGENPPKPSPPAGGQEKKSPPAPLDEIQLLRAKVMEYEEDLKRLQAEFQNYQNRVAKEKLQARIDGQAAVLRHFLSFADEMESALAHLRGATEKKDGPKTTLPVGAPSSTGSDTSELRKGVELLHLKLVGLFASLGVKEISGNGAVDPHQHEVMMQVPGGKEGQIAQVLRKGYVMGEHVLRVAQVSVYSGIAPDEKKEGNVQ